MASDIRLDDNSVILDGNVGIGTTSPTNKLHFVGSGPVTIENPNGEADVLFKSGSNPSWQVGTNHEGWYVWDNAYRLVVKPGGETHSRGSVAGFSFADRTKGDGERWVWYAQDGTAHLWSQKTGDALSISTTEADGLPSVLALKLSCLGLTTGSIQGVKPLSGGPANLHITARNISLDNPNVQGPTGPTFHKALTHAEDDKLVINESRGFTGGVTIDGNVKVTGALTQASSIALKENVAELSGQEAMAALRALSAVKFNYKADSQKEQRLGFIAEEVPDLVASSERDRLSPMDIIAVLTKAVQELAAEVNSW
jgi:hypothetical protein